MDKGGQRGHGWLWPHSLSGRAECEPMLLASEPPLKSTRAALEGRPLGSQRTVGPCLYPATCTHSSVGVCRTLTSLGFVASSFLTIVPLLRPVPARPGSLPGSFRARVPIPLQPPCTGPPASAGSALPARRVPLWAPRPDGHRAPHTADTQCVHLLCASTRQLHCDLQAGTQ